MALRIRIEHGQDAGKTWRLGVPGTYRFGRNPASSVQVLDMKVSKDHFEIAFADGADATIRDLESSHGTLLIISSRTSLRPMFTSPRFSALCTALMRLRTCSCAPSPLANTQIPKIRTTTTRKVRTAISAPIAMLP